MLIGSNNVSNAWAIDRESGRCIFALARPAHCLQELHLSTGEIDLVALHQKKNQTPTLVFVEVRYRSSEQYGSAAASIDETKQLRLIRSAEYFLNAFKEYANLPMRFDAVLLTRSVHQLPITWIKDAFNA